MTTRDTEDFLRWFFKTRPVMVEDDVNDLPALIEEWKSGERQAMTKHIIESQRECSQVWGIPRKEGG